MPESYTRGYIDGCFDLMHSGHFNAIRQAKQVCSYLIVGIHSDLEIEQNKSKPIMTQDERYALLSHIKWIDEIITDVPYTPTLSLIEKHNIDFVIHGDDMPVNKDGVCAYDEIIKAGKMKIIKRTEGVSTTDIIGKLLNTGEDHQIAQAHNKFITTSRRISEFSSRKTPTPDDTVVYVDGSFDLFNISHAAFLEEAKMKGTFLMVGIFDDPTVTNLVAKNPKFPIMSLHERVLNVLACKHVDEVLLGSPFEVNQEFLKILNVKKIIVQNASDRKSALAKSLGIYEEIPCIWPRLSAEFIVNRILENKGIYVKRNQNRSALEQDYYNDRDNTVVEL
jgi:ethanolamine-phosphate cytidylyltransferase